MRFEKWEAAGNDFVLVEGDEARARWGEQWLAAEPAVRLCDRHRGIGADGVLILDELDRPEPRMIVLNADGSRPEMCGNGLRCVVGYGAERRQLSRGELVVRTDAGARSCELVRHAPGAYAVTVDMGIARVGASFELDHGGRRWQFVTATVGNPHAVTFEGELEPWPEPSVDELGARVDAAIEGGSNVEFCRLLDGGRRIEVVVFERGVGRTLACGTGACAAAAVAVARGSSPAAEPLEVDLPGGRLAVTVRRVPGGGGWGMELRGPARRVFTGSLDG